MICHDWSDLKRLNESLEGSTVESKCAVTRVNVSVMIKENESKYVNHEE